MPIILGMKRVLLTGFEPFGGEALNPTSSLSEAMRTTKVAQALGESFRSIVLPVTFADSYERLKREIEVFDPRAVICLGLAGGRSAIELERVAINCLDAVVPDNSGLQPRDLPVEASGPAALFATLPIRQLLEALSKKGIPAKISNSAGTYVCNYLLYRLLADNLRTTRACGFVHVPYLPEQVIVRGRENVASMPFDTMLAAIETITEETSR